ncbi:MAG: hypothetical protein AAF715_00870 [Myxococcota bacterium]
MTRASLPRRAVVVGFIAGLVVGRAPAAPARGLRTVDVVGPRLTLGEVMAHLSGEVASLDLGPVPAPGRSRLLRRGEVEAALAAADYVGIQRIPVAVRIRRKMVSLSSKAIASLVADHLVVKNGVTMTAVRAPARRRVPAGYDVVRATVPRVPRRAGTWRTAVTLHFHRHAERIARLSIPATLEVTPAAAVPDVEKGHPLVLVVRRGQIEVRVRATAGAAADIGERLPVSLRPSGRIVPARLTRKDQAVAL